MKEEDRANNLTTSMRSELLLRYRSEIADRQFLELKIKACVTEYLEGIGAKKQKPKMQKKKETAQAAAAPTEKDEAAQKQMGRYYGNMDGRYYGTLTKYSPQKHVSRRNK